VDEHVQIRQGETLTNYLNCMAAMKADVVLLNWRVMTDNGLTRYDERPMAERFTQPMADDRCVRFTDIPENDHVKAFVRGGVYGVLHGPYGQQTDGNAGQPDRHVQRSLETVAPPGCP
jgi:hypothetical protein